MDPKSVAEAVDRLINKELTEENIEKIRHMTKWELNGLHFGMGMWIRNNFGLWQGNKELLVDCAKYAQTKADSSSDMKTLAGFYEHLMHSDDASSVIADALWER